MKSLIVVTLALFTGLALWHMIRSTALFLLRQRVFRLRDRFCDVLIDQPELRDHPDVRHLHQVLAMVVACIGKVGILRLAMVMGANPRPSAGDFTAGKIEHPVLRDIASKALFYFFLSILCGSALTIPVIVAGSVMFLHRSMKTMMASAGASIASRVAIPEDLPARMQSAVV